MATRALGVAWSQYGSCQLCIWSYEVLNVEIKNFVKELLRKGTLIIAKAIPWIPESAFLSSISFYFRLSLVEYFCTHGSLTLVAGEVMSRSVLDRAAWLLFSAMTISKCVALGQGSLFLCSVIYYNATPLLWFVITIILSLWNNCLVTKLL